MTKDTPHNIAIFLDGTWNDPDADQADSSVAEHTNVYRLFVASHNNPEQHCYYIPGVGTDIRQGGCAAVREAVGLPQQPRWLERLRGGLFGDGLTDRILEAYGIICQHFRPERNDRLFIFGFSRGAFAARSLVNFIDRVGILFNAEREKAQQENDLLHDVRKAYRLFENDLTPEGSALEKHLQKIFGKTILGPAQREGWQIRAHFLGLWDTVATRGCPIRQKDFRAPRTEDLKEAVPASVMCVRHALAAHEFRALFEPLMLWESANCYRNVQQQWFPGSHADVGGGYPANESGLAVAPLLWIAREASERQLQFDFAKLPAPTDVSQFQLHLEGHNPSVCSALRKSGTTLAEVSQVNARRRVRAPLLQIAARNKRGCQSGNPTQGNRLRIAGMAQWSNSAYLHLKIPINQRHASWTPNRSDIKIKLECADRCLFRLMTREADAYFLECGLHNERSALTRLTLRDLERIQLQLATGKYITDHESADVRVKSPIFSRLDMLEQAYLAAVVSWIFFDAESIETQLALLELDGLEPYSRLDHVSILVLGLKYRWRDLNIKLRNARSPIVNNTLDRCFDQLVNIENQVYEQYRQRN